MELGSTPETLYCSECGDEVGMTGCAPELDEVADADSADALLYVRVTDEGIDVLSTKE
jgi:hypothetical protein